jgi:AraC-like DNA-binding protein
VRVLAGIPEVYAQRLRRATGHRFEFRHVAGWADAVEVIRAEPVEIAVFDPGLESGQPRAHEIERIRLMFPSLPLILYAQLTPLILPVLLEIGRLGVRQIVVADHDDHPGRLVDAILEEAAHAVSRQLITAIEDVLNEMPQELRWAIETVVRDPASYHSVQDLAERARMDRRTCVRWFTKAQLPPPRAILIALRVIYAHRLLQDPGYTVEDVALRLGYPKVRPFVENVREIFGLTPAQLRVSLTREDAIGIVRERYFTRPAVPVKEAS